MGPENHAAILESFINSRDIGLKIDPEIKIEKDISEKTRAFLVRR